MNAALRRLTFATLVLAAAPARADLAVSCICDSNDDVRLYYVEGAALFQAVCRPDTELYDRSTCRDRVKQASVTDVMKAVDAVYDAGLGRGLRMRDDLVTKILRTDVKIDEYLATSVPDQPVDALQTRLADVEDARRALVVVIRDLEDQAARIEDSLRARPDADLAKQLAAVTQTLGEKRALLGGKDAEADALRRELVGAYTALATVDDFKELVGTRRHLEVQLEHLNDELAEAMQEKVVAKRHEHRVFDPTYTWETLAYSRTSSNEALFAGELEAAFGRHARP